MRKLIVCVLFAAIMTGAFSQEEGKVRGGLDLGYCIPTKGGGGFAFNLNIGYNLQDNMNVGLKLGVAAMAKVDPFGETGSVAANVNYLATFNYYFSSGTSPVAPFVGCGAGLFALAGADAGVSSVSVDVGNRFGGLLTAGVELGKFRLAFEYNMIPSSAVKFTGTNTGPMAITSDKIKNSYFAITTGVYFGGGKWRKS